MPSLPLRELPYGLHVCGFPGVSKRALRCVRLLAEKFQRVIPVRHHLIIEVVPANAICYADLPQAFAIFLQPKVRGMQPRILIIGMKPRDGSENRFGKNPSLFKDMLPIILAHELAHYEQFRDRRKMTERGVNVRARSLLKMIRRR